MATLPARFGVCATARTRVGGWLRHLARATIGAAMTDAVDAAQHDPELPIRQAFEAGQLERAATVGLELYGRELLGFLIARVGEQRGHEVFSDVLEDLWRGLPAFEWRSSLRTWLYTLARHALARHARGLRRRRDAPLDTSSAFDAMVERVRSETAAHMQTAVKSRFRELRAQLPEDDQNLLILRVDRHMSWRDLAVVMCEGEAPTSREDLDRHAARMRQRFQQAKARLRALAEAEGLVPSGDDDA